MLSPVHQMAHQVHQLPDIITNPFESTNGHERLFTSRLENDPPKDGKFNSLRTTFQPN